jgi:hypothetical protein
VDASLFVDYGGAWGNGFDGISWSNVVPSIGFGLYAFGGNARMYRDFRNLARFELAWAPGEWLQLYLTASF